MSTIAQNLQTIATAKANIATSINNKGGSVTSSTPLSAYSAAIDAIPSGGGGGVPDWSEIGYSTAPQMVLDAHAYAKNIYDNWDNTEVNLVNKFSNNKQLVYMPLVDTSNATNMGAMFSGCSNLEYMPLIDTSKVTNLSYIFKGCSRLATIPQLNTSACTQMGYTFQGCSSLTTVPEFNTSACTNMSQMFSKCSKLEKIEGLDFTSVTNITNLFGTSNNTTLRYALFKNLGTTSGLTSYGFSRARNWGVADSTYTDARQSLVDSLLTYSFDRATAGYPTCTIWLYSTVKNLLTAQEISDIQAKGYTITT